METTAVSPLEWYRHHVLPALAERLDTAFPEFAFKRDQRGWVATNQEATRRAFGVRADRVVCHGDTPPGFLIHGADPVSFTSYLNQGETPRGRDFVQTIRDLATRTGIDTSPLDWPRSADRRSQLLDSYQQLCEQDLHGERGRAARAYHKSRGISLDGSGGYARTRQIPHTKIGRHIRFSQHQLADWDAGRQPQAAVDDRRNVQAEAARSERNS